MPGVIPVSCAVDCTASTAGGLISFDIDASLIYITREGVGYACAHMDDNDGTFEKAA